MRLLRGMEIVLKGGQIKRIARSSFLVKSQTEKKEYQVKWRQKSWTCGCLDFAGTSIACKHINAVSYLLRLPPIMTINLNPDQFTCPNCRASPDALVRTGVPRDQSGLVQRYK